MLSYRRIKTWSFLGAVIVLLASSPVPALAVPAAVGCASSYGSLFDGYVAAGAPSSGATYEGTLASIVVEPAVVCDTNTQGSPAFNIVYTWTMIAAATGSGGYAQIGVYQSQGTCAYYASEFLQNAQNDNFHRQVFTDRGCLPVGASHQFWEQYLPTTGHLSLNVDVTPLTTTPFDPYSSAAWSPYVYGPFRPQFFSETKYLGSNVPNTHFAGMKVQGFDDSFTDNPSGMGAGCDKPDRYVLGGVSGDAFPVYTSGASHAINYC